MPIITISRQYASGGSHIAQLVADRLDWPVVDNEFIDRVAELAGLPPTEVEAREERVPGFAERLARALAISSAEVFVATGATPEAPLGTEADLVRATEAVISRAVQEGKLVIVGRGAQAYLAQRKDTLHVYICAPRRTRINATIERMGLTSKEAEDTVDRIDRGRRRYVKTHYDRQWDDPTNYDLALNTEELCYEQSAELIVAAAGMRGWR